MRRQALRRGHHVQRSHSSALHVSQWYGQRVHAQLMLFHGQAAVIGSNLIDHSPKLFDVGDGASGQTRQRAALEPLGQRGFWPGRQQHAPRRGGVRRQACAQVQAIGQHTHNAARSIFPFITAAPDDNHLIAIEHAGRKRLLGLRCQTVQGGLNRARQPRRRQVAARKSQHLGRQPVIAAIGFQIAQMCQGQQVAARRRARDTGPLGGERGVQALTLRVKAFQHRHAFGHAFNQVGFGNRFGGLQDARQSSRLHGRGYGTAHCAIIAQIACRSYNALVSDAFPLGK